MVRVIGRLSDCVKNFVGLSDVNVVCDKQNNGNATAMIATIFLAGIIRKDLSFKVSVSIFMWLIMLVTKPVD